MVNPQPANTSGMMERGDVRPGCEDWIELLPNNSGDNLNRLLEYPGTNGQNSGLRVKFNSWKSDKWMCGTQSSGSSSKGIDNDSTTSFKNALDSIE